MVSNYHFSQSSSYSKLAKLASFAPNLALDGVFNQQRIQSFRAASCGLQFLYAAERVDESILEALQLLVKEAELIEKMEQMQRGDIVNKIRGVCSENRKALHTACRSFLNPASIHTEEEVLAKGQLEKLRAFLASKRCQSYTDLIVVGIGGSDLGPFAVHHALELSVKSARPVHFINNVDPDLLQRKMENIPLESTLVAVVSKSGSTLETKVNELTLRSLFKNKGIDPATQFVSVTCPGSALDDRSRFFDSFYMWDFVGGRFSCSSMVGALPLGFSLGLPAFEQFLLGAAEMDQAALCPSLEKNLPLLGALLSIWNRNFMHLPTHAVIPYADALKYFPAHFQQVEMESNGKSVTKEAAFTDFPTSMVVWGEPGTCSQHSFFQFLHQAGSLTSIEFIGFIKPQRKEEGIIEGTTSQQKLLANMFAQSYALAVGDESDNPNKNFTGNRPSHLILADQLTPYTAGAYLSYFEHKVAFEGFAWNINSFDQEGVQLGKRLADKVIDTFSSLNKGGEASLEGASLYLEFLS